jgi:hypothetical protein
MKPQPPVVLRVELEPKHLGSWLGHQPELACLTHGPHLFADGVEVDVRLSPAGQHQCQRFCVFRV